MNRRNFLQITGLAALAPMPAAAQTKPNTENHTTNQLYWPYRTPPKTDITYVTDEVYLKAAIHNQYWNLKAAGEQPWIVTVFTCPSTEVKAIIIMDCSDEAMYQLIYDDTCKANSPYHRTKYALVSLDQPNVLEDWRLAGQRAWWSDLCCTKEINAQGCVQPDAWEDWRHATDKAWKKINA